MVPNSRDVEGVASLGHTPHDTPKGRPDTYGDYSQMTISYGLGGILIRKGQ